MASFAAASSAPSASIASAASSAHIHSTACSCSHAHATNPFSLDMKSFSLSHSSHSSSSSSSLSSSSSSASTIPSPFKFNLDALPKIGDLPEAGKFQGPSPAVVHHLEDIKKQQEREHKRTPLQNSLSRRLKLKKKLRGAGGILGVMEDIKLNPMSVFTSVDEMDAFFGALNPQQKSGATSAGWEKLRQQLHEEIVKTDEVLNGPVLPDLEKKPEEKKKTKQQRHRQAVRERKKEEKKKIHSQAQAQAQAQEKKQTQDPVPVIHPSSTSSPSVQPVSVLEGDHKKTANQKRRERRQKKKKALSTADHKDHKD